MYELFVADKPLNDTEIAGLSPANGRKCGRKIL